MSEQDILKGGVDRSHAPAIVQKTVFFLLHLAIVIFLAWFVFINGVVTVASWVGWSTSAVDPMRLILLFGCAALYCIRHGITLFYLLMRKVDWSEVFGLAAFIAVIEIGFAFLGSGLIADKPQSVTAVDLFYIILVLLGACLNSGSEMQRKWWKQLPENKGKCYQGGLFRYSMHINYFGDVVMFTGWALLTHSLWALLIPVFMLLSFIFIHIPALDLYLAERYGEPFLAYQKKTRKLIPFIY